jgi:hypothetical protein
VLDDHECCIQSFKAEERGNHKWAGGTFIREEVEHQERLEAMRYRSLTWRVLRALQGLFSAVQLHGESAVTAHPFFPTAGTGTTSFWGHEQGPTVFLSDSLSEAGREGCERVTRENRLGASREQRRARYVRRRMRRAGAAGQTNYRRRQSATSKAQGVLDKRRWSLPRTMRASGSYYAKSVCMEKQIGT